MLRYCELIMDGIDMGKMWDCFFQVVFVAGNGDYA